MICWLWNGFKWNQFRYVRVVLTKGENITSIKEIKDRLTLHTHEYLCSKALLLEKIALVAAKMETLLGAEFETLDRILYLAVVFFH